MNDLWGIVENLVIKYHSGKIKPYKYSYLNELWNKILDINTDLIVFRAPTGIGKTEAILAPLLAQYLGIIERSWLSLVYVLPTRSLVNAMFWRISKHVNDLGLWGKVIVTLDYGEPMLIKPYLEGDIVITTYDTLIYTIYGLRSWGRHYRLPLGKLSASLIVMDEVQLLQDVNWFTPRILISHLKTLLRLGSKIVLMSATIPDIIIEDIKRELERGGRYSVDVINVYEEARRGELSVEVRDLRDFKCSDKSVKKIILDIIKEALNSGLSKILVVMNTVSRASNIFQYLRDSLRNIDIILLHSRLRRSVRKERELKVRSLEKLVLVSTQVIEAGLDYNFDLIITDASPIDSLIQRLGRVARRVGDRGKAYIIIDDDGIESSKVVYGSFMSKALEILSASNVTKELSKAVKSISSTALINEQYSRELINEASEHIRNVVSNIKGYIEGFIGNVFEAYNDRIQSALLNYLVRLGLELKVFYPEGIIKEKIDKLLTKSGNELQHHDLSILNIIHNNMLSLQINVQSKTPFTLPESAIKPIIFYMGDRKHVIRVDVTQEKDDNKKKTVIKFRKITIADEGIKLAEIKPSMYYALNPMYYEFLGGEDLGLIRLR